jgi:hypothetical protein
MDIHPVGREAYPRTWPEYERLVLHNAEDPEVVIGFRPGGWKQYVRQFLGGTEDPWEGFELGDPLDAVVG